MDDELRDILRFTSAETGLESCTHFTMYDGRKRWAVTPKHQDTFWSRYCNLVYANRYGVDGGEPNPSAGVCLCERPQQYMPCVATFTFKFQYSENESWEPYDDMFLQYICNIYQTIIGENFRCTSENAAELIAVVLESEKQWIESDRDNVQQFIFYEVKFHFPYAKIETSLQKRLIRPKAIAELRNQNIMRLLQRQPIGDWEQIISSNFDDPFVMFGSNVVKGRPKLEVTNIWSYIDSDTLENGRYAVNHKLSDVFDPTNHNQVQQRLVSVTLFDEDDEEEDEEEEDETDEEIKNRRLQKWLPMFLSANYWNNIILPLDDVNTQTTFTPTGITSLHPNRTPNKSFGSYHSNLDEIDETASDIAEKMLSYIGAKRYAKEAYWIDIGKALYNACDAGENGLKSWIHHTQKAANVLEVGVQPYMLTSGNIPDTCRSLYDTFSGNCITEKTLAWYAREDNPVAYADWHKEWCTSSMEKALSGEHSDVAKALFRVYWMEFVYYPIGSGKWFQFKKHRWFEAHQGIDLRFNISNDFVRRFEQARATLSKEIYDATDESFKANGEITMKKITSLISRLKNLGFKRSIMGTAEELFKNDAFIQNLDANPMLTGVTNGILEVCDKKVIFRTAKPEDFISMTTNIPFHSHFTLQTPLVMEVLKWLKQVFVDEDLFKHFMKFSASCLKGKNSDKIFPIMSGDGDNSKSMIIKLFEATLFSYCIKFDISNVTNPNSNASGPTPQLARAKATRIAFMDEPDDDVPMNKSVLKRWVGGDSFFCRLLQDNGGDVKVTFKLVLTCNKVPIITNPDKAIQNRTRIFPYLSNWVDNPPETEEEQRAQRKFKKDPNFEAKIPRYAPAFLWLLTEYYEVYEKEGLNDPQVVKDYTAAYWRDNDFYAQFGADCIREAYNPDGTRDMNSKETLSDVYSEFKSWYKDSFPNDKVPTRPIVRAELSTRWGRLQGASWPGIRLVSGDSGSSSSGLGGVNVNSLGKVVPINSSVPNSATVNPFSQTVTPAVVTPQPTAVKTQKTVDIVSPPVANPDKQKELMLKMGMISPSASPDRTNAAMPNPFSKASPKTTETMKFSDMIAGSLKEKDIHLNPNRPSKGYSVTPTFVFNPVTTEETEDYVSI